MRLLATRFLQFLTCLLLNASLHAKAYYIAPGCTKYGKPPRDLRPVIKSGMQEAQSMAAWSKKIGLQVGNDDRMDNSKVTLFAGAKAEHYKEVIGTYTTGDRITLKVYSSMLRNILQNSKVVGMGISRVAPQYSMAQ
jgi:hypothetical protein